MYKPLYLFITNETKCMLTEFDFLALASCMIEGDILCPKLESGCQKAVLARLNLYIHK